jgi:predicted Zn-dependent peptidase
MTYPDYTYYLQHQSHENLNKSIELMFESIYNSYFSKEDLDNEKKVVLSEASEYIDNDSTFLYSKNRENLFKNTSISRFFFGNKSTLKKISIPVFEDFYKYCRNPKNAFLIIAGTDSLNESLIIDDLNRLGSEHTNVTDIEIPALKDKLIPLKKTYTSTRKRKQSLYLKSFRGSKMTIDKKIYFDFFKSLLSDGFNSKLISRLRDELGLIYWAYLNIIELKPFFEITIETSTEKKNLKVISSEMKSIIQQLYKISQNEIDNLKELVKFNILSTINAVDDATFALTSLVEYEELITTEEYLKKIANTKVEEVTSFIKDIESESMESILN